MNPQKINNFFYCIVSHTLTFVFAFYSIFRNTLFRTSQIHIMFIMVDNQAKYEISCLSTMLINSVDYYAYMTVNCHDAISNLAQIEKIIIIIKIWFVSVLCFFLVLTACSLCGTMRDYNMWWIFDELINRQMNVSFSFPA